MHLYFCIYTFNCKGVAQVPMLGADGVDFELVVLGNIMYSYVYVSSSELNSMISLVSYLVPPDWEVAKPPITVPTVWRFANLCTGHWFKVVLGFCDQKRAFDISLPLGVGFSLYGLWLYTGFDLTRCIPSHSVSYFHCHTQSRMSALQSCVRCHVEAKQRPMNATIIGGLFF